MSKNISYINLLGETVWTKDVRKKAKKNPLIAVFGNGPEGKKCKDCKHHYFRAFSKKYPKCDLRNNTATQATDHSSLFPACGKFEPKES